MYHPTLIGFYVGNQDSFLADNRAFNATLNAAHIRHTFAVCPGGHAVSLWEKEAPSGSARRSASWQSCGANSAGGGP